MSEVTDLKAYRDKRLHKEQVPRHFDRPPAAQQKSRNIFLLAAVAMTGVVAYQLHFVVLPYACALACVVIVARLVRSAVRSADKPEHPRGPA